MLSPEIAITKEFNTDVLMSQSFSSRLILLAIDELHLIFEWADFRPAYAELQILRSRISQSVSVIGVTATLDSKTLE